MKRELGIGRCGLACCLCSENDKCHGCNKGDCPDKEWCENLKCSSEKGITECIACDEYPCIKATVGDYRSMIHTEVHYADEITWGILPYVPWQYERRD